MISATVDAPGRAMTRSGTRGSASPAVPMATSRAPARRYCRASSAVVTPPTPMTGIPPVRSSTRPTARTPIASSAGPLTPPVPVTEPRLPSSWVRLPGIVFTTEIHPRRRRVPPAPCRRCQASAGESLAMRGRRRAAAAELDDAATHWPGRHRTRCRPRWCWDRRGSARYAVIPATSSSPSMTARTRPVSKPTTLTMTRVAPACSASHGR